VCLLTVPKQQCLLQLLLLPPPWCVQLLLLLPWCVPELASVALCGTCCGPRPRNEQKTAVGRWGPELSGGVGMGLFIGNSYRIGGPQFLQQESRRKVLPVSV
jgi:hypothetical protein